MKWRDNIGIYIIISISMMANAGLLWQNYNHKHEVHAIEAQNDEMRIHLRSVLAQELFGNPFVPEFNLKDLDEEPVPWPKQSHKYRLMVFFSSSDCGSCLLKLSSLKEYEFDGIPVMGIVDGTTEDIGKLREAIDAYEFQFSIYIGDNMPFQLKDTPYVSLVSQNGDIYFLEKIGIGPSLINFEKIQDLFDRNRL